MGAADATTMLELTKDELAVLLCFLHLGMDGWAARPLDIPCMLRLDRLPEAAFASLAAKISGLELKKEVPC